MPWPASLVQEDGGWEKHIQQEKEVHLTSGNCPVYSDIREKYTSLEDDQDLVSYFQEVLDRRDLLDRLEDEERDMEDD